MDNYPPIEDHGLIGDLQTAALVSKDGSIDWFCCPRFDSPSVFGSLLDHAPWGALPDRARPIPSYTSRQLYFPDSAILITRFMCEDGVGELVDFMPVVEGRQPTDHHTLVRLVRCVRGEMSFDIDLSPRFDYGRLQPPDDRPRERSRLPGRRRLAHPPRVRNPDDEHLAKFEPVDDQDVRGRVVLSRRPGARRRPGVGGATPPREIPVAEAEQLLARDRPVLAQVAVASRPTPGGGARTCSGRRSRSS